MADELEFHTVECFGQRAVVRADLTSVEQASWWSSGVSLAFAKGRGGAAVIQVSATVTGVARDFRRGGRFGHFLARTYFDRGRPERELRVLASLRARGVPVVVPLAALARRTWLFGHRLRLVTELVSGAVPLPRFLADREDLRRDAVREAGRVIGAAFAAGLEHRDLHPDNLIARSTAGGGVEVVLLDLDRAVLRDELAEPSRDRMLVRMARYLKRHEAALPVRPARTDFVRFLAGTGLSRSERRVAMERLLPRYDAALRSRGLA